MIFINEFLPNPAGVNAQGEWLELANNGANTIDLNGWKIISGASKFSLSGKSVLPGGYLLLPRSETKLALKNADGGVELLNARGVMVDAASFTGSAPEGKSFSRINYENGPAQHFVWSEPTPAAANKISLNTSVAKNAYPAGVRLNPALGGAEFAGLALGVAVLLAGLVIFILKKHEDLSHIFFARDEEAWL